MRTERKKVGERVICNAKKIGLIVLVMVGINIYVQAQESVTAIIEKQNEIQEIELSFMKAISEIDKKEKQLLHKHDSICQVIELRLNGENSKKLFGRISKKERKELAEKLEMETNIINTIRQLNMVSRQEIMKKYETRLNEQLVSYDTQQ